MRTRTLLLAIAILVQSMLLAQNQVSVMPVITPPYSIYLSDYQGALMVNLTNQTMDPLEVKLVGSLSGDNGYSARTNSSYSPASPIYLGGLETKVLYANSPALSFIDLNNLQVNAPEQIQNAVIQTGILPEGNYALCIQALDYYTNELLSPEEPSGCMFFNISNVQPPMLTFPWCDGTVNTEWPVFTWSPPIGNINMANVQYDLYILELLPGQNPTDAMWLAIDGISGNPIVRRDLMIPSYPWQPYDPSLKANTTYAVAVVARDITNMSMIENKGRSEVCTFIIDPPPADPGTPVPISPGSITTQVDPNIHVQLPMGPIKNTKVSGRLVYQFKEDSHEDCGKANIDGMPFPVVLIPGFGGAGHAGGSTGNSSSGTGTIPLRDRPSTGNLAGMLDMSTPMGPFNFSRGTPGNNTAPSVAGQAYSPIDIGKMFEPPEYKWRDPYPVAPVRSKPMKNVPINLVVHGIENGQIVSTTFLTTETTDSDGGFSFSYNQLFNTGVNIPFSRPIPIYVDHMGRRSGGGQETGWSTSVLAIEVASPYYCSPDLMIYTQPGDDVELPEQVCYVRSYNMEVQAIAGECEMQMGESKGPLSGVDVVLTRTTDRTSSSLPENEGQDADELVQFSGKQVPLISRCVTGTVDGKALFRNLVYHGKDALDDYHLEVSTDPDRGLLNYRKKGLWYPDRGLSDQPIVGSNSSKPNLNPYLRNSDFEVKTYPVQMVMTPHPPRILGRVMVSSAQPLANATVKLVQYYDKGSYADDVRILNIYCGTSKVIVGDLVWNDTKQTDENGYFEFDKIEIRVSKDGKTFYGPHAVIEVSKPGYRSAKRPLSSPSKPNQRMDLMMGVQWDMTNGILLEPFALAKGIVENEEGEPIRCDVQVADGPWARTKTTFVPGGGMAPGKLVEGFEVPAPSSHDPNNIDTPIKHEIHVIPLSDQYFPLTVKDQLIYPKEDGSPTDLGTFTVKEKKHRVKVVLGEITPKFTIGSTGERVPNGYSQMPVPGALVRLGDEEATTNAKGEAHFEFRTPETEFRLRVNPPGVYTPVDSLIVNNVSPEPVILFVEMKSGRTLRGKVIDEQSEPIANARVWIELGADQYGPKLNQTITAANGEFTLNGVPNLGFEVHAAKSDPAISYIGTSQVFEYVPQYPTVTLTLKVEKDLDLTSIYGFPVEVTKQVKNSDGTRTISGAFIQLPSNGNFRLRDPDQRIPFSQVKVKAGPPNASGVPRAEPVAGKVNTDQMKLELKLFNNLDVALEASRKTRGASNMISAEPTTSGGLVNGIVSTELSSFNFSYDFTGRFYLGDGPDVAYLDVFRSNAEYPQRRFNLMTRLRGGVSSTWYFTPTNAEFTVRGFAARSDRTRSFVDPDVFRIATVLQVKDIPDITPGMLELDVGEIRVTRETIDGISGGGDKLNFKLNNWSFESITPWTFNSAIASIVIPKGILKMADETGKLVATAEVNQILIRPKTLEMDLTNVGEIRLGGAAPVQPLPETKDAWKFGYDAGYVYHGKTGAWRLGALTNGKYSVATIQGPADMVPSQLKLSSFSMVSRGAPLAEVQALDYRYFNIMDMTPVGTFAATPNGVDMHMNCSMAIHGFPTVTGFFSFYQENGVTKSRLQPLVATIRTGRGGVEFILDSIQAFSPGKFTSYGNFRIPPEKGKNGTPLEPRGFLSHTAAKTNIEVILVDDKKLYKGGNRQVISFGDENKKMLVNSGNQEMAPAEWNELAFSGNLVGMGNLEDNAENKLDFVVKGAVALEKGELKMEAMETPFGDLTMSYDFEEARLIGDLTMTNVIMGAVNVEKAHLNILVDGGGFLVSCFDAQVFIGAAPWPFQHHHPSFMIGGHDAIPANLTMEMMKGYRLTDLPIHLQKRKILGLFLQNKMSLINFEVPKVNLLLFSVWGKAECAAEAQIWVDLNGGGSFGLAGLAYADVTLGFSIPVPPCDLLFNATASAGFVAKYEESVFTLAGCASVSAEVEVCGVAADADLTVRLSVNSKGDMTLERSDEPCASAPPKDKDK